MNIQPLNPYYIIRELKKENEELKKENEELKELLTQEEDED